MKKQRYILQPSQERDGWYVLTDVETQLVCRFAEHRFNETQAYTFLDADAPKKYDPQKLAAICNQMAEWGMSHHYDKMMPPIPLTDRQRIGFIVTYLRRQEGMTQDQLADLSGVNRVNIAKIEAGKYNVSIDILSKIAAALGVEITLQ